MHVHECSCRCVQACVGVGMGQWVGGRVLERLSIHMCISDSLFCNSDQGIHHEAFHAHSMCVRDFSLLMICLSGSCKLFCARDQALAGCLGAVR